MMESHIKGTDIAKLVEEIISKLAPEKKAEFYQSLNNAISTEVFRRAMDALPEDKRQMVQKSEYKTEQELASLITGSLSQDQLQKITSESVEYVMQKFADNMEK